MNDAVTALVMHGLMTRVAEIDDGETAVTQQNGTAFILPMSFTIRAPVGKGIRHFFQLLFAERSGIDLNDTGDATHAVNIQIIQLA
jgi:hypothetical protein